jgi:glutaredoxin
MQVLLFCAAVGLYQNWDAIGRWLNPPPPRPAGAEAGSVVLYATSWCGYCAKTREFFAQNHIAYQELNVENSAEGRSGYMRLGGGGVPIVVVNGDTVIRGYAPNAIVEALGRAP